MTARPTRRLPLLMRTVFQDLYLITYRVPTETLAALLPPPVFPVVHNGSSYISIVIGNMRGLRPAPTPEFLGTNYYQVVYRALVEIRPNQGPPRVGVFFLRSDCNDPVMSFFGNRLTEFKFHYFHTGAISTFRRSDDLLLTVETRDGGGDLVIAAKDLGPAAQHPPAPGFDTVDSEKHTLVQLFNAFAHDPDRNLLYDMEIERAEWQLRRLSIEDSFSAFFAESPFQLTPDALVSAVLTHECSYIWKPMTSIEIDDLAIDSARLTDATAHRALP